MSEALPVVYMARHGYTAWTHTGQHTGLSDLPLRPDGERNAVRLGERLKGMKFAKVSTSSLQRAARTCELSGFGAGAITDRDLVEWDYGQYEGLSSAEILKQNPSWAVPRRRPGRRIAGTNRRARRPCSRARPCRRRRRAALFQRTLYSGVYQFSTEPGQPKRS